ncbi:hypothetical protein ACPC3D_15400 [Streptomyces cellulosae]
MGGAAGLDQFRVAAVLLLTLAAGGALRAYVPPPPSVLAAYAEEPELSVLHMDLPDALRITVTSLLLGVLPRG